MESGTGSPDDLRHEAITSLKKKEAFRSHLFTYLAVNALLVVIWFATGADGIFWPIFPIVGWGIAVAGQAWDAYKRNPITEDAVAREAERLRARGAAVQNPGEPGKGKPAP